MSKGGSQPSCMAWRVMEKDPVMIAWLAMMVASVASTTSGINPQPGASRKNGLAPLATGPASNNAAWPA